MRTAPLIHDIRRLLNVADIEAITPLLVTVDQFQLGVIGLPGNTHLYRPRLVAGRWLQARDPSSVVVNDFAAARLHLHLGQRITIHLYLQRPQQAAWTIFGIVHEVDNVSESRNAHPRLGNVFTTLPNLNQTLRHLPPDASQDMYVRAHDQSPATIRRLLQQIRNVMSAAGQQNAGVLTTQQQVVENPLLPPITLLFVVAVATVSSTAPAVSASRLRVHAALRYE